MAKQTPTVLGVLTQPARPTGWKANRHKVLLVLGLLVGYWIGTHVHGTAPQQQAPQPVSTAPAPAAPDPHRTPTGLGLAP
ncbi:hypothetical protein ACFVT2_24355 [Streptomyces sp. NPDC058000]|uniref:hypothetical protein n=1 Tax=Streptomyces sp. NPDC058000 TaxID=3346299 RepID=UPI0036EB919A